MPSIVGNCKIVSNSGGIAHAGDSVILTPTFSSKTYAGSGSFLTGDLTYTETMLNITRVHDSDAVDNNANKAATGT